MATRTSGSVQVEQDSIDQNQLISFLNSIIYIRLARNNITISHYKKDVDRPLPNPVTKFIQAFGHYPEILSGLQHFKEPSPIQCQAWPVILKGHDMIGIAQTGTGKKLAFLLPALIHVQGQRVSRSERGGPCVLIIVPGRQYSRLIEIELSKFPHQDIKW